MKISGETIQKEWEKVAPFAWGFFSWCPAVELYGVVLNWLKRAPPFNIIVTEKVISSKLSDKAIDAELAVPGSSHKWIM